MTRSRFTRKALTLLPLFGGAALLVGACNEFDPDLYKEAQSSGGSSGMAGGDTGGTAGAAGAETGGASGTSGAAGTAGASGGTANWDKSADWCPVPEANLLSSNVRVHTGTVALNTLTSDVAEVPKVTGLTGPDGVIGFRVAAEERVSVKYDFAVAAGETPPEVDLSMYLMGACDVTAFIRRNERCPAGKWEDIWWQMNDAAGTYYLGFDSKGYDQALLDPRVKLTVSFPRYGDGIVDQGEACDDSNKNDNDGCTHDGLWELKYTGAIVQEKEPNDHPWGGNRVIMTAGQTMIISGLTAGTCDNDFFAMDVQAGWFPRVTMLSFNGGDCTADVGTITMQFNRLDGTKNVEQVKLGDGKPVGSNFCPSWTETSLALTAADMTAGRYVAELKGFEVGKATIPYRLKIEMVDLSAMGGDGGV